MVDVDVSLLHHSVYPLIKEILSVLKTKGVQVYLDGTGTSAMMGLLSLNKLKVDICVINADYLMRRTNKNTGAGAIMVKAHLSHCLPTHFLFNEVSLAKPGFI